MPHGAPDWSKYRRDSATFPIDDLAELAARLGSVVIFDRRGDVLWMEDFESGLVHITTEATADGASVTLSPLTAKTGGYSAKLTTGNNIDDYARILHWGPQPTLSRIGFENSFTIHENTRHISFAITVDDGTSYWFGLIRYAVQTGNLYYRDEDGNFQSIATNLSLRQHIHAFQTWKLVIDYDAHTYARLILNQASYNLSAYNLDSGNSQFPHTLFCRFTVTTNIDDNVSTHLDNLIITQDEP